MGRGLFVAGTEGERGSPKHTLSARYTVDFNALFSKPSPNANLLERFRNFHGF